MSFSSKINRFPSAALSLTVHPPSFCSSSPRSFVRVWSCRIRMASSTAAAAAQPPGSASKPLINLLRGWPNADLLPAQLLKSAAGHVLSDPFIAVPGLEYGPDWGDERLREALAKWLSAFYSSSEPPDVERISITGGASQNLACVLQTFTDPAYTRNIWMVAPTYMLAFRIFHDSGFDKKLRAVPEDEEGLDVEYLRAAIEKSEQEAKSNGNDEPQFKSPRPWSKIYKHVIYAVPTFSNPSSKTMSLRRRQELVKVAREYDALVVSDDVYDQLQWPASVNSEVQIFSTMKSVMPRLVDVDKSFEGGAEREGSDGFGNVVSNGSFSKICGPGVRTGWVEGTKKFAYGVSQTGTSRSGGAPSHLTATFLADLLSRGDLQTHISSTLQPTYQRRYNLMLQAIQYHLIPLGCHLPQSTRAVVGGYFIWLRLPTCVNATELAQRAKNEENLIVAEGALFEVPGDTTHDGTKFDADIRLCFTFEDESKLREGVERLGRVVGKMVRGEEVVTRDGDALNRKDDQSKFW